MSNMADLNEQALAKYRNNFLRKSRNGSTRATG